MARGLFSALARKWRTLRRQSLATLLLLGPVWVLMGLASLALRVVPQHRLARLYGRDVGIAVWLPLITSAQQRRARHIRAAIGIAARYGLWRADCYPQALVARVLLRLGRVPHVLCFGLRRREGRMQAHAWVHAGCVPVCGGMGFGCYTLVRAFVSGPAIASVPQALSSRA